MPDRVVDVPESKTLFQTALSAVKNTVWNDKFL
jgi:hypothetical protein